MEIMKTPYRIIRNKLIFELLDKYPDASIRSIAKIFINQNGNQFGDFEEIRNRIRYWRGSNGNYNRKVISTKKYFKDDKM